MTAWNLAVERTQLRDIELIAAGHLRSGNRELVTLFDDLIRATKGKIVALEEIERLQKRPESKTTEGRAATHR
jgi:hypothetical protein